MTQFVVVSLVDNQLKVSIDPSKSGGFKGATREITTEVISDPKALASIIFDLLIEINDSKPKKPRLHFLIEPQDIILRFITIKKNSNQEDSNDLVLAGIKEKLIDIDLEEHYYSYQRIAPFVYQLIAIKKITLDKYMRISEALEIPIESIVPWILLLPRLLDTNDPCIFLCKRSDSQIVALSEFNGIYFSNVYASDQPLETLQGLVQKLSAYERTSPIDKVYTLDYETFSLDPNYTIEVLPIPNNEDDDSLKYKYHVLFEKVMSSNEAFFGTQINLLNLISTQVGTKNKSASVYIGVIAGGLLVLGVLFGGLKVIKGRNSAELPLVGNESEVLSGSGTTVEATESTEVKEQIEVDRKDFSLRVENGSGADGAANKSKDYLENLGYSVLSIGNASENRENTLIKVKSSADDSESFVALLKLLEGDLKKEFSVVTERDLDNAAEYDALVIIGSE